MSTEYDFQLKFRYAGDDWRCCKVIACDYPSFRKEFLHRLNLKSYKFKDDEVNELAKSLSYEAKNIKEFIRLVNSKTKIEIAVIRFTKHKVEMNFDFQFYKGIKLKLINRSYHSIEKSAGHAKRFTLNNTNQNVWIPNKHLLDDGTIKQRENIDYVFRRAQKQLTIAGYTNAIPGIKRKGR